MDAEADIAAIVRQAKSNAVAAAQLTREASIPALMHVCLRLRRQALKRPGEP